MIATGYVLPFRFVYTDGVLASAQPASLHIRFGDPQGESDLVGAVDAFALLAASGALCGVSFDPALSTLTLRRDTQQPANELRWAIERTLLCPEALVVLAHLMLAAHERADIELVEVVSHAPTEPALRLAHDPQFDSTYPALRHSPGFVVDDDELEADAYAFEIELDKPLAARNEQWMNTLLAAWARVVELGGFGAAPVEPVHCYVEPDETLTTYAQTIEWALFKLRADEACIDTLLSGLVSFHARCQKIVRVTVR
jgi:hypothetical protein